MHLADLDWLPILRRIVGTAAVAMAFAVIGVWVGNFALRGQVAENLGAGGLLDLLFVLGWVEIVTGAVVLLGFGVGLWFHRLLWAPGVLPVVFGMSLYWGWWLLDRRVDLFGTSGFNDPDPELFRRAVVRMWVMLGVDTVAVALLLVGAVLLLRRNGKSGQADPPSDSRGHGADENNDDVGSVQPQGDGRRGEGQQSGVESHAGTPAAHGVQHGEGRQQAHRQGIGKVVHHRAIQQRLR